MLSLITAQRKPLTLQSHRPVPIPTYIPSFDPSFNPLAPTFDPNPERSAANKLRAQYKKERLGAIRELRKDNKFLAGEEERRRKEKDERYKEKIGRIVGGLQMERAEEKRFERIKEREKKRDKKARGGGRGRGKR